MPPEAPVTNTIFPARAESMAVLCPVQGEQGKWHLLPKRFPKKQTAAIGWMAAVLEVFEPSVPRSLSWGYRFPSPWENSTVAR
jgi:hypothetical protein